MLHPLVSHSPDLRRLFEDGYAIEIRANQLVIKQVPYATANRTVAYGTLVSELTTAGSVTGKPGNHQTSFVGEIPCDDHGRELDMISQRGPMALGGGLTACCMFSRKAGNPGRDYDNYYDKMTTYINLLFGYAQALDPSVTARVHPPFPTDDTESVFRYLDSASSRAQISALTEKLKLGKVAIIGLGGTGSYILDLIAKTPIEQIHLYDGDKLLTHNVFRAPGAASLAELDTAPKKVDYFQRQYDALRRNIVAHPVYVDETNVEELRDMAFVFLAMDSGPGKRYICERLEAFGVPFIDTGVGVYRTDDALGGLVRTTTSTPGHRQHLWQRVSFADEAANEYDQNIQIAELNALNAAHAVIRWKKLVGFYVDQGQEYSSTYRIGRNRLLNEDHEDLAVVEEGSVEEGPAA